MAAACPVCRRAVSFDAGPAAAALPPHFPFCSERCKLVDLGRWFTEEYRVSRPLTEEEASGGVEPVAGGD